MRSLIYSAALLAVLGTGAILPAQAQQEKPAAVSPLLKARTIQVQETFSVGGTNREPSPFFTVSVQIASPERIRMDVKPVPSPQRAKEKPSLYLLDGTNEYEYNGIYNYYTTSPAPTAEKRSRSQLRDMAAVELLLNGEPPVAKAPGVVRTTSEETLNGRKLAVTTYTLPEQKRGDSSLTPFTRIWTDPATGFPVRRQECFSVNGKSFVNLQTDFSDWKLDAPIADQQFVWKAPEGSKPYEGPKVANVGKPAPDFTAYTPEGKAVKLSDYKGKVVILDFWATWCGPCQRSMPHLEKVYQQVKDKDVVVLAVCVWDEKDAYDKWVVQKKGTYSFPTLFDTAGRDDKNIAKALYSVDSIPTQFVIDKNGNIAAGTVGYDEASNFLESALKKLGVEIPNPVAKQ